MRGPYARLRRLLQDPPPVIAQALLKRVPGQPFEVAGFHLVELTTTPTIPERGVGELRRAGPADVDALSKLEGKRDVLYRRFEMGDECVVAIHEGCTVGYAWYSTNEVHLEARFQYPLRIPPHALYGYDAFIRKDYRLRGVWVLIQHWLWREARARGRERVLATTDFGNEASLKAHRRFGYRVRGSVLVFRCGSRRWFRETLSP